MTTATNQQDVDALWHRIHEPGNPAMIAQACTLLRKEAVRDLRLPDRDRRLPLPTVVAKACDRYNDPADTVARGIWRDVLIPFLIALEEQARQAGGLA